MASELGFTYTELREMPLPEYKVVEDEVNRILEHRRAEARRIQQGMPRVRGRR